MQGYGQERAPLIEGFTFGFDIGFQEKPKNVICKNLKSASSFAQEVDEKITKKIKLGRIASPFVRPPFHDFVTSPLGVVPKKEIGSFRMIQHLSHPVGTSINDGIPSEKASVQY